MDAAKRYEDILQYICPQMREQLMILPKRIQPFVHEIRLRGDGPVVLVVNGQSRILNLDGTLSDYMTGQSVVCSMECLQQTFRALCGYSVHTHQQEIAGGYLSLPGGHRAGLGGTAVITGGVVTTMKEISSLNLRIARETIGAADPLFPLDPRKGLLIVGRPGSGKTTLLRDLARQLGGSENTAGIRLSLLDERGELAAVWDGVPQNHVGWNTDVLCGYPKPVAMEMAIRCLSPDVVLLDEIGSRAEAEGIMNCMYAGVGVIASVHAGDSRELAARNWVVSLLRSGAFEQIALLGAKPGDPITKIKGKDLLNEMDRNCDFAVGS